MAILTIDQFATKCVMPRRAVMVYIKRSNVIADGDMIDTNHEKNVLFFNKREAKGLTTPKGVAPKKVILEQVPREDTFIDPNKPPQTLPNPDLMDLGESEQHFRHFNAKKTESEAEIRKIEIAKKKGDVIPSELIGPLVLLHNQSILIAHKNADEEILTFIGHKYELSLDDMADTRQKMVNARNAAMQNATKATMKGLQNIITQFSEKRGVGQK